MVCLFSPFGLYSNCEAVYRKQMIIYVRPPFF